MAERSAPHDSPDALLRRPTARRGFTLVELLVVIAIIAVLITILLPVLGGARTSARTATAEVQIRDVLGACDQFMIDNRRLPGRFSARDMAATVNADMHGMTSTENVLLDLMGVVEELPTGAGQPDNTDCSTSLLNVSPRGPMDTGAVFADSVTVTLQDEGKYLSLNADQLFPVWGQMTTMDEVCDEEARRVKGMPDIVDPFGQPLLVWAVNKAAPLPPNADPSMPPFFAAQDSSDPAVFYWASNAGYFASDGLGEDGVNQSLLSILGSENDDDPLARTASLAGVLGSPAYPVENPDPTMNPWVPARPRGDIVVMSAGPDKVYFNRFGNGGQAQGTVTAEPSRDVVGYAPTGQLATFDSDVVRDVTEFDDLVRATGG